MKTWEERFEKVLVKGGIDNKSFGEWYFGDEYICEGLVRELKSFIASELQKQKEGLLETINKEKINQLHLKQMDFYYSGDGYGFGLDMPKNPKIIETIPIDKFEWARIYNQALDDILKKLEER